MKVNYVGRRVGAEATDAKIREGYEEGVRQVRSCGVKVSHLQAGVSQEEDVHRMVRTAVEELGGLDTLINGGA